MNPEEFAAVAGLFDPSTDRCPQCGMTPPFNLTAPYCDGCLNLLTSTPPETVAIRYRVPSGTKAWRWIQNPRGIDPQYEPFTTSREVEYGPEDLCPSAVGMVSPGTEREWYVFVLPSSAAPWDRLKVEVRDVKYLTKEIG